MISAGAAPTLKVKRQQHGDCRHRADARQHADQRAEQAADEAVEDVLPPGGDAQSEPQVMQRIHAVLPLRPYLKRQAEHPDERGDRKEHEEGGEHDRLAYPHLALRERTDDDENRDGSSQS